MLIRLISFILIFVLLFVPIIFSGYFVSFIDPISFPGILIGSFLLLTFTYGKTFFKFFSCSLKNFFRGVEPNPTFHEIAKSGRRYTYSIAILFVVSGIVKIIQSIGDFYELGAGLAVVVLSLFNGI